MLKPAIALLGVFIGITARAQDVAPVVVVMGGAEVSYSISIGKTKATDLLGAFSQLHRQSPNRPVHLLVPSEASISRVSNVLGTMSKAEILSPRVFVYTKQRDTMQELSISCPYLFSDKSEPPVLAHGLAKCP